MIKNYFKPSQILSEYIDRYWFWESEAHDDVKLPKIYPGSGLELVFHYKTPFTGYPKSHILCPRSKDRYFLNNSGVIGFISVRFKCWAFPYFCNLPITEIKDEIVDLEHLWSNNGKTLEERINLSININEKVNILNHFFESILQNNKRKENRDIDWAINYIYYNYNSDKVRSIINDSTISPRSFQRKFKTSVGVSAKHFQKITRFEKTLKYSILNNIYPNLDLLLFNGYFDQSHFNKDFKEFTGYNPTEIITLNTNLAHFYNKSLRSYSNLIL